MSTESVSKTKKRMPVWLIILLTMVLTAAATVLIIRHYFFPQPFDRVELNEREERALDQKIAEIIPGYSVDSSVPDREPNSGSVEAYDERNANREIRFSERELNALLAKNTDLSDRLAVDLSKDLLSARLLVTLDPDFPVMSGKTVRITAGMQLAYENDRPIAVLRGVSIMGVPVPNEWLGGLKNVDLVQQFNDDQGFWSQFSKGIDYLKIDQGELTVRLRE